MKSATATVSYPLVYQRDLAIFARGSIGWTDEIQQTNVGGMDEDLSHDRITAARVGLSYNGCGMGCLGVDAEISKGLELGSRSNSQVGNGTPLSRSTATSNFTHFRLNTNYTINPYRDFIFMLNAGGQYTLNDLLNSEQTGITGEQRLSGFTSGAISGDEAWYVRGQVNKQYRLSKNLSVSPYIYTAGGTAYLNQPTAAERTATSAKSIGLGLEVTGNDEYFFDKSISAKVEYSKNWATGNIENTSSVRLNREHLLVTMAMRF
jgi:hemolysin activation/secretion protein